MQITLTPAEREAVAHRLGLAENIAEVFADTEELEHLAPVAEDRARELCLELERTGAVTVDPESELDREIMVETLAGSTYAAGFVDDSPQKQAAIRRALESAAEKIEVAFGLDPDEIEVPLG